MDTDTRLQEYSRYYELKQMAYNIAALQQEKAFHSLAVLSFLPGEGKTLFCAAMAMAYAEACKTKVLIVDTTTFHHKHSFVLKECLNGLAPLIQTASLEDLRSAPAATSMENDFSLIKKVAEDRSQQHGLVLFDTAALQAKNRSNMDPLLIARLSSASVMVVSRTFLDAPHLTDSLKLLKDPALHLLGIISNEGLS